MTHILTLAAVLGLSAGFAPGPLLTLVIAETLRHDIRAGVKVAIAPFVTDLPIILFSLVILSRVSGSQTLLAVISFCGSLFVARLGFANLTMRGVEIVAGKERPHSLSKGIVTNLLSPHPYLFWLTVGVPIMSKVMSESIAQVALFLGVFYCLLVGSKIFLAVVVGRSKTFLQGNAYIVTMRVLGLVLLLLAASLFADGFQLMQKGV